MPLCFSASSHFDSWQVSLSSCSRRVLALSNETNVADNVLEMNVEERMNRVNGCLH